MHVHVYASYISQHMSMTINKGVVHPIMKTHHNQTLADTTKFSDLLFLWSLHSHDGFICLSEQHNLFTTNLFVFFNAAFGNLPFTNPAMHFEYALDLKMAREQASPIDTTLSAQSSYATS